MKHENKIKIISIIPAILIALLVIYFNKTNYANNNLFRFTHVVSSGNKISYSCALETALKDATLKTEQKSFICSIEKPVNSETFLDLLIYLKNAGAKNVIIDADSSLISKYNKIDEINNLFAENPKLFIETLCWNRSKSFVSHNSDSNINSFFSIRSHFPLSYTAAPQPAPNMFCTNKIHFCPYTENTGTMQDFLFRLDKKYVVTLPFALYAAKYDMKISDLRFEKNSIKIGGKTFYYDSQVRFAFKGGFVPHEKPEIFSIENKEKADVSDSLVFITSPKYKYSESDMFNWISIVLGQLRLLEHADPMFFPPEWISFLLSLMIFVLIFLLVVWINQFLPSFMILCTCFFSNFILYFFTVNFQNINYPLVGCILAAATGFVCAETVLFCKNKLWQFEVFKLFTHSAAMPLQKKIASDIATNKLKLSSQRVNAVFIQCEISGLPSSNTDSEEYMIHKNEIASDIESCICENNGIVCSVLSGYYSQLFDDKQYIYNPLNTVKQCRQRAFGRNMIIAVHHENEYFGYTKHICGKNKSFDEYKPLGNSLLFTEKMIKIAKKFNIKTVVSESMVKIISSQSGDKPHIRMLDRIKIKDTSFSERLFELIPEEDFQQKESLIELFHAGLKLCEQREWKHAAEYFSRCLKIDKNDMPSIVYLQRCKKFTTVSPKENWDGIYEID